MYDSDGDGDDHKNLFSVLIGIKTCPCPCPYVDIVFDAPFPPLEVFFRTDASAFDNILTRASFAERGNAKRTVWLLNSPEGKSAEGFSYRHVKKKNTYGGRWPRECGFGCES